MSAPRATADSHSSSTRTAAPSLMMKPSRSASNGRETPTLDSAVMLANPATEVVVIDTSLPPVSIASHRPLAIKRAALPIACVDAEHAVTVVSHGPRQPYRIDSAADAPLAIIIGTRNG